MNRVLLLFSVLALTVMSCRHGFDHNAKPGQGMITYSVSYPEGGKYGMKTAFFPKEIILVFKDDRAAFIATGAMGMIQLVNLLDHGKKSYTSLLIDNLRGNYGCLLTPNEIKENETAADYKFEPSGDTKTIAGLQCSKAIVKDVTGKSSFDVFYYDKIKFYYWNSPFKDFNYLLTEYTHTINDLTMKLVSTKVDLTTPVDTSLFNVKGNYRWVSQKEFYDHLLQL